MPGPTGAWRRVVRGAPGDHTEAEEGTMGGKTGGVRRWMTGMTGWRVPGSEGAGSPRGSGSGLRRGVSGATASLALAVAMSLWGTGASAQAS